MLGGRCVFVCLLCGIGEQHINRGGEAISAVDTGIVSKEEK